MLSKTRALAFFVAAPLLFIAPGQSESCRQKSGGAPAQKNANRASPEEAKRETRTNVNDGSGQSVAVEAERNANSASQAMNQPEAKDDRKGATGGASDDTWGGEHIRVELRNGGADIEYDCAHGTMSALPVPDAEGRFVVAGTHVREGPGPIRVGIKPVTRPARFTGKISGDTMTLSVVLTDTSQEIGTFTLTRGSDGRIQKCR